LSHGTFRQEGNKSCREYPGEQVGSSCGDAVSGSDRFRHQLLGVGAALPARPKVAGELHLGAFQQAFAVAAPVSVGSAGRIPVEVLTDRYGGRAMFALVSLATIVPTLYLGYFGQHSFVALVIGGFFLGLRGTAFAAGVPFANAWFPRIVEVWRWVCSAREW
jgi:MFS transporter